MMTRKLTEHFCPTPSPIVQHFKFNICIRILKENITQYVICLWELIQYYDFGDTLNDMLGERLVSGVNNEQLQRRLLSEPQSTFKKALEISQTFETAARDARDLQKLPRSVVPIHAITQKTSHLECYHFGEQHDPLACRHQESPCHTCGRKGHLATNCLNSQQTCTQFPQRAPPRTQQYSFRNAHNYLETDCC